VKDGRAVKLQGDPEHPFTRGVLCTKVNGYLAYAASPDRLLYPMRRIGPKGRGDFARISWDEALDEIAERLGGVIREFGPEAIWPYLGSGSMGLVHGVYAAGRRLWNALGASHHLMTICTIAGGVGTGYTLGDNRVGMDPETLRFSKLIILWGSNTLSSNHHLWRPITTARQQGAHLVVIDPIRTRTADAADSHLAPIPGTDAALALGLLHVVLGRRRQGLHRAAHAWLGCVSDTHSRVSAGPRRRHLRRSGPGHRRPRNADRPYPAHRNPRHDGAPAAWGRRDGGPDHHVHSRRDRRLASSRRRGGVRHARVLRHQLAGPAP
jgi:anaerobic selenocysteine-containing dehydrogenase